MSKRKRKCKTRTGPRGGKYQVVRKHGGGTRKKYLSEDRGIGAIWPLIVILIVLGLLVAVYIFIISPIQDERECGNLKGENYIEVERPGFNPNIIRVTYYDQSEDKILDMLFDTKSDVESWLDDSRDAERINDLQYECGKAQLDALE